MSIVFLLCAMLVQILGCLDFFKVVNITHKPSMMLFSFFIPHISLLLYAINSLDAKQEISIVFYIFLIFEIITFGLYIWLKFNIRPYSRKQIEATRLRILMGGRRLLLFSLFSGFAQSLFYTVLWVNGVHINLPPYILTIDILLTITCVFSLHFNGLLRILFTSRRLSIFKRIFVVFTIYIPIIQIFTIIYICNKALTEYEHESYKVIQNHLRIDSAICQTKYPLVLLHGVGFRDFKYINYWGRIPKELMRHGATIFYGNQEAWGTIESNAADIKEKIIDVLNLTGCDKVNIIAHSKGGLDARYMISQLNMADYVASLTMMSSPHRGSKVIDFVYLLPKWFYEPIGLGINRYFRLIGDKNPDFLTASKQFLTCNSEQFNNITKDADQVYYQSYASVMNNIFSDYILSIPYLLVKLLAGENDGLVTVDSAKWGEFKGVLKSNHTRGISHGDMIDLRKDDYKGFDVREHYVTIVEELKTKGF